MNGPSVLGSINYLNPMPVRPAFHAHDFSRDNLVLDAREVEIRNGRAASKTPALADDGFALARNSSIVLDYRDTAEIQRAYLPQMERLLLDLTGAKRVMMFPGGVLRFGERSKDYRTSFNSRPARFAHVDYTQKSAPNLLRNRLIAAGIQDLPRGRFAGYNLWRVLTQPPQDVPLAVCDARSVASDDLVPGDAVFDAPGAPEFSFEAYLVRHNAQHRWSYFPDMQPDEVLVFKAYDTDPAEPQCVPHCAFSDSTCLPDVPPRASIEVRGFAFFDD
jgi:hypothetical protein